MTEARRLRTTPLHDLHIQQQANLAEFGGYKMPLWYPTGAKAEHLAVIERAGLFDTSHMAVLSLAGDGAFDLLQQCFSRDLNRCLGKEPGPLKPHRSIYGLFLKPDGSVLDDAIVSELDGRRYMVVVNSAMGPVVAKHLQQFAAPSVQIMDHTDRIGKIDLQGPAAAKILEPLLADPESVFAEMPYFSFVGDIFPGAVRPLVLADGTPLLLSRSGYTGEFGFELFCAGSDTGHIWRSLLQAGAPYGLIACGLAARDSLRTGAMLPLSHQDIGDWKFGNTPWSFALPLGPDGRGFTKPFIGAEALQAGSPYHTYGFAGYDPRKIPATPASEVQTKDGECIGTILTCTTDMAIDRVGTAVVSIATPVSQGRPQHFQPRGLSCGFIRINRVHKTGENVLLVAGKRKIEVEIRNQIRPDRTARRAITELR